MQEKPTLAFGGSRDLNGSFLFFIRLLVLAALRAGFNLRTGCAPGADAFFISACITADAGDRLEVFSASEVGSAPQTNAAANAGAVMNWNAGGGSGIPFSARLAIRARRCVRGSTVAVFFTSSPGSRGSMLAAATAARSGSQVFILPCFDGEPDSLPGLPGAWVPAMLAGLPVLRWVPAQPDLF